MEYGFIFLKSPSLTLKVYTDTDWASSTDSRRSSCEHCVCMGNSLISYNLGKLKVVSRLSTKVEFRALTFGITELVWIQNILHEL